MEEMDRLRPFGMGNEEPVLLAENVCVEGRSAFGAEGRHVKAEVSGDGRRFDAVAFNRPDLPAGGTLDILFSPQWNSYRGSRGIRLRLIDVRPAVPVDGIEGAGARTRRGP